MNKEIIKTIKELFYLAGVEYTEYDAMANNPTPEEEAEKVLKSLISQAISDYKESLKEKLPKEIETSLVKSDGQSILNTGFNICLGEVKAILEEE